MIELEHKGYRIEVSSYRSEGGRWRPAVSIDLHTGSSIHSKQLGAPAGVLLETEAESDQYGVAIAVKWIDDQG